MDERNGEQLAVAAALERVADIARELAAPEDLDETLQQVVDLAVDYVEHCEGATMLFVQPNGDVVTPAWSGQQARAADLAQHRTGEGPCMSALREHETIIIEDMASEDRWPLWRDEVSELGWRSMVGLRLFVADDSIGALDLYSSRANAFDRSARALATVFASHAAVAIKASISEAGLHHALAARDVIGQAKGVLMEREDLSAQQAFQRLRRLSNDHNIKLRDLARDIAETRAVPGTTADTDRADQ